MSREEDELLFEGLRHMDGAERVRRMCELMEADRSIAMARARQEYPGASEQEVRMRVASRTFDRETMIKAWGWDPALAGGSFVLRPSESSPASTARRPR